MERKTLKGWEPFSKLKFDQMMGFFRLNPSTFERRAKKSKGARKAWKRAKKVRVDRTKMRNKRRRRVIRSLHRTRRQRGQNARTGQ